MTVANLREILEGDDLSSRELEVLHRLALGETAAETGKNLFLAEETVKEYRKNIVAKLGARNLVNAVALALGIGLLNVDTVMEAMGR